MNKPWSNLPNAPHIDWVLSSLKDNPDLWASAWDAGEEVRLHAAFEAAWAAERTAAGDATGDSTGDAAWVATRDAAWDAAWVAILALIAYDDCDQYLTMSYEELRIWAALSEHPAAVLLTPTVRIKEKLNEVR